MIIDIYIIIIYFHIINIINNLGNNKYTDITYFCNEKCIKFMLLFLINNKN
jgi:hypothetical protein